MSRLKAVCVLTLLAIALPIHAADDEFEAAYRMLESIDMARLLRESAKSSLEVEMQANPALLPYREVMLQFFEAQMGYDSLKDELAAIYAEAFTADELDAIAAFYQTPVGRKTIEKMPELLSKGAQLGASRVQQNIGELQRMIQEEAQRLRALQEGQP